MARTVLDLDEELLRDAATELGTTTKVATVRKALEYFQKMALRHRAANLLSRIELDLSPENMQGAWR